MIITVLFRYSVFEGFAWFENGVVFGGDFDGSFGLRVDAGSLFFVHDFESAETGETDLAPGIQFHRDDSLSGCRVKNNTFSTPIFSSWRILFYKSNFQSTDPHQLLMGIPASS